MYARAVARTWVAMTSADVGESDALTALVGVPLIVGLGLETVDSAGLGDNETWAVTGELGAATGGAEAAAALPSAVGWLTFAEQPASKRTQSGTAKRVPRRYPTGGGYVRESSLPELSTG